MSSQKNEKALINIESNEDLQLLNEYYPWVISELLSVYFPLSLIREKERDGYFLLPCSEENLLINLKSHNLKEINLIEKEFPDFFKIKKYSISYTTESRSYPHYRCKHDDEFQNIDAESTERVIQIQDQLLYLAEHQYQQYVKNKSQINELPRLKTKADLLTLHLINRKTESIDSMGLILADLRIRDSEIDNDKHNLKMHFPLDRIPNSKKEFIWDIFMRVIEKNDLFEKFFRDHDIIMIHGHLFNSSSCKPRNFYLIPETIWRDTIKIYTDTEFEIRLPKDLSNSLHSTIKEIEFIDVVIERKFDNNLSMKKSNYEQFNEEIEKYCRQGFIQIGKTGEIITPRSRNGFVSRRENLTQELRRVIERYLNLNIEQDPIIGKLPERKSNCLQSGE